MFWVGLITGLALLYVLPTLTGIARQEHGSHYLDMSVQGVGKIRTIADGSEDLRGSIA